MDLVVDTGIAALATHDSAIGKPRAAVLWKL
jgi:hypothetical protein